MSQPTRRNPFGPGGQLPSPRGVPNAGLPSPRGLPGEGLQSPRGSTGALPSPRNSWGIPSPRGSSSSLGGSLHSPRGEGAFAISNPYGLPGSRLSVGGSSTASSRGSSPTPSDVSSKGSGYLPGRGAATTKAGIQSTIQQIKGEPLIYHN